MANILVMEDDVALLHDITDRLSGWGHHVVPATNIRQGLASLGQGTPDIIISDVGLPDGCGLDVLPSLISEIPGISESLILIMSAGDERQIALDGTKAGGDDFFAKPINYELMKARIDSFAKKRSQTIARRREERVAVDATSLALGIAAVAVIVAVLAGGWYMIGSLIGAAFS